ncbi:MAG: type I methionyl aminopeptidase [Candidatus Schekmanbacteria bacterium]|nr:type I methionyl aminopeptidase [Candidatus Schekmanbacteria bacterium]
MIALRSPRELDTMRRVNRIVAEILTELGKMVAPGVKTKDLDEYAEKRILELKCKPAFKGYKGYPATLCISVNNEIVHGIPAGRVLCEGDIVSIDIGAENEGYFGDAAATFPVGKINENARKLIDVTRNSLEAGIREAREGNRLGDISNAIQLEVERNGFSVVKYFVGHGIGRELHEPPQIPNFGEPGKGIRLKSGMVFAIEPMVNEGSCDVEILNDGWTAITKDGKLSAHFEHTIAIKNDCAEILTLA